MNDVSISCVVWHTKIRSTKTDWNTTICNNSAKCKEEFQYQRLTKDYPEGTGGKQGNMTTLN